MYTGSPLDTRPSANIACRSVGLRRLYIVSRGISSSISRASALSQLDFGVDRLQFPAGVIDLHLPVDAVLGVVYVNGPGGGFGTQRLDIAKASAGHTLTCQGTQLVLGDVQPTAVLGRV